MLPLLAGKVVQGHLLLTSSQAEAFDDPRLQDALASLAALATLARANALLYGQTREKADELDALWAVGQSVVSSRDLGEVADALTERVCAVFGAEICTLSLWETAASGERHLRWQGTRAGDALIEETAGPIGLECAGCDRVTQQAALTGDVSECLGVPNPPFGCCRWRAIGGQSGTHSILAVPLRHGSDVLGALTVYRSGEVSFRPDRVKLLGTLATLAVAAVHHARAFAYEHNIAQTLQRAWLPDQPPKVPGLDIAANYAPARTDEARIGGDYYDFLPLGANTLGIVIGDISGKGLAAAVYTAMAKYTLRAFAAQGMPPREVVSRANVALARHTTGELFSTLFYGVWDGVARTLTYVNAGHEPPQWAKASGEIVSLDATGPILGAFPDADYDDATIAFSLGDVLALFTDGLPDCRDSAGEFFGEAGIRATLAGAREMNATALAATLQSAALDFPPDHRLHDDIALLVLKVTDGQDSSQG